MTTLGHLHPSSTLVRCMLHAVDGEIGALEALYFDDAGWMVRYLLVDTGDWLAGRRVLISPVAVGELSRDDKTIYIELTRRQIEDSPPLDANQPVSKSYDATYYRYYDWEDSQSGVRLSPASSQTQPSSGEETHTRCHELCLQRTSGLNGCVIVAHDGAIGQIRDLIVDTRYCVIRYLAIETHRGSRVGRPLSARAGSSG